MNNAAIVTGASSGIGLEISKVLCRLGYEVFGIGRDFHGEFAEDNFHAIICDILDTEKLCNTVKGIAAQNHVTVLVNNAGTAYYGLHEEMNARKIQQMVRTNLEAPMILTCLLLRALKKARAMSSMSLPSLPVGQIPMDVPMAPQKQGFPVFPAACLMKQENTG